LRVYADSSFLVSLYANQENTGRAMIWMRRNAQPLPFTELHRHEVRNAVRLAVWRNELTASERQGIFRLLDADLQEGVLVYQPVKWTNAFREADRIGGEQSESTGLRSADLLHIGIASITGATDLLTFDAVQRKAAIGAGLMCPAL
jgi:predicted nucleic acid-binding protein